MLPEECQDDVVWALARLNERQRTQADILFELNDRLAVKGQGPISRSAFSRRSVRMSKRARQLEERSHLYAGIAEKLTPEEIGQADIVLGEFLKTLIDELLDHPQLTPKNAMELARAYQSIVAAQRTSVDRQEKSERATAAKLAKAVDEAVETVAKEKGMSAETVEAIKQKILGVRS
ncbi:DUF3486 family protein [Nitratireductor mangrovi]|uniref:DUF3486 family protein n=1 Tax=Nitratireductor mangrovi TaxID=2599600 RepID=A0A5B8KTY8_9HYPH|nr:DUF3486 family protein [Nitratireductor mangrovi]